MQQPAGGGAGSQLRVPPDMAQMLGIPAGDKLPPPSQHVIQSKHGQPEAASPISALPPAARNFDELVPAAATGFPDEEELVGEEAERGPPGNRWPRQETVALLKIRSDMDAAFRDATLKAPLWEVVSRKLGEMGYNRSAKKCKEKFENVHKYYKRTKEGRAGRQDGKSYRFFSQLEALHSGGGGGTGSVTPAAIIPATTFQPPLPATPISVGNLMLAPGRIQTTLPTIAGPSAQFPSVVLPAGISFSTSSEEEGEEDESEEEEGTEAGGRKRRRAGGGGSGGGGSCSKRMMSFFEGLIKQVMERQEGMQQRFLETIEKRDQDRMIREEAWKRQEMAKLAREHELMTQERAMAASRDTAVIGFLQKITGQTITTTTATAAAATTITTLPPPTPPSSTVTQPLLHPIQTISFQQPEHDIIAGAAVRHHPPQPSTSAADAVADRDHRALEIAAATSGSFDPASSSSRWPKAEVHALIKLRSGLEGRYQEAGPKGPLWEEISAEMRRIGYNRSSKRCKEKWENINKYFKKVKESNKKRPEDAKTCPYFHQLDALYKKKLITVAGAGSSAGQTRQDHHPGSVSPIISPPLPESVAKDKDNNTSNNSSNKASSGHDGGSNEVFNVQIQTSNGDLPPCFLQEDPAAVKKPEDIMKELMEQQQQSVTEDYDSDNLEVEENVGEDDNDDGGEDDNDEKNSEKTAYKIQFQRQGQAGLSSNSGGGNVGSSPATTSTGSFLAVVQ